MHDRYAKTWYQTLTFDQKSSTYNADGTTTVEIWHEAMALPSKLRIDLGDPAHNDGYLLVDQTLTTIHAASKTGTSPLVNMLLVLGFDVYRQGVDATIGVVKTEGYDLKKFHTETWNGRPVYVVGADEGDLTAKQFWVDQERLLFVRLFEPSRADSEKIQDIRFADYRKLAGGWVAARVDVYANERIGFSEEYSDIKANVKLDPGTFDSDQFAQTHWE